MQPIVLIHGYSAEGEDGAANIPKIYGSLPQSLKQIYGRKGVVEINLSRYISLEDGVTIDDISRALDRALHQDFPHLLQGRFHVIIHSTGALVSPVQAHVTNANIEDGKWHTTRIVWNAAAKTMRPGMGVSPP